MDEQIKRISLAKKITDSTSSNIPKDIMNMPVHNLAYIGDAVEHLFMRTHFVSATQLRGAKLNSIITGFVNATAQADSVKALDDFFTEEEKDIIRHARNTKITSLPRNANKMDYHYATAFEALLGALFLKGDEERICQILSEVIKLHESDNDNENTDK